MNYYGGVSTFSDAQYYYWEHQNTLPKHNDDKHYAWVLLHKMDNGLTLYWDGTVWINHKRDARLFASQSMALHELQETIGRRLGNGLCVDMIEVDRNAKDHMNKLGQNTLIF